MNQGLSIYQQVLGADFDKLPPRLAAFHSRQGDAVFHGEAEVQQTASIVGRQLAAMLGTPAKPGRGPIRFELHASPAGERWTRNFVGSTMTSELIAQGGRIVE